MDHSNDIRTALSIASEQGKLASVCGLLEEASIRDLQDVQYSNVNLADKEGRSPISYAAGNGHFEISKLLLQHGANAHLPDLYGRTPLSWAAGGGHFSTVRLFLSPKYNVNANSQDGLGQTPLLWACANGHFEVVAMMLARHDIFPAYPTDYNGNSPLAVAAANGRESVIKILLTYKTVIQDWAVTSWKEEMAKDEWRSNHPGAWNFRATIGWDHTVSVLPQNKAIAHGHWDIAKLLRLHWEGLDMGRYPIPDNAKEEFKETTNIPDLNTHAYDPSGSGFFYPREPTAGEVGMTASDEWATNNPDLSTHEISPSRNGSYYTYEQDAGEVGMPDYDESGATNNLDLLTHEYDPLHSCYPFGQAAGEVGMPAFNESGTMNISHLFTRECDPLCVSYPYEQAAGDVRMPAHDELGSNNDRNLFTHEYSPSDHDLYYYPYGQTAAAFEAVVPAYDDEFSPTYAQSSTSEEPVGVAINYYDNNNDTRMQTALTKKHRKRCRKSKATNILVAKDPISMMRKGKGPTRFK